MTAKAPTVSVILATYNRAEYISQALDSLRAQTRPVDEIVVVDDGSTDNTAKIVAAYGSHVRYLHQENGGKPAALNLALTKVDSDYIWIFDDDDIALPHALADHLSFLATHPEYDFSYSPQYVFSGEFSQQVIDAHPAPSLPGYTGRTFFVRTMEAMHSMMQGMLVPRRCYQEVGPFDQSFIRGEDHEMVLRLARRFNAGYMNEPTFALRMHDGARGSAADRHGDKERARVLQMYRKCLFQTLHAELSLSEYLPETDHRSVLTRAQKRRALAQRFCITARNGVLEHALEDYRNWRAMLEHDQPDEAEKTMLSIATQIDDTAIATPKRTIWRIGQATGPHLRLLKPLSRGLYWSAARELRRHNLSNARTPAILLAILCCGALVMPEQWRGPAAV